MKKIKRTVVIICLLVLVIVYVKEFVMSEEFTKNVFVNASLLCAILILTLYVSSMLNDSSKGKNTLFDSVVEHSNSIYIMLNSSNNQIIFLSSNVEEILSIDTKNKTNDEIVSKILSIPIIKNELNTWDKKSYYVSQMLKYNNPKYNHDNWIRLKINPYKENDKEYFVIEISDVSKEHEKQHLLVTQATNIKARENQLNQITSKSYDMEINIDVLNNTYDLRYFKLDNLYFGEEKRGLYTKGLKEILEYVNELDKENVESILNIENLSNHFSKYELDSEVLRYRIGNDVKNNTWLESTIFFLSNNQKQIVSILTKNVTENAEAIREQNVKLQNALNEARKTDKSKTDLIRTISHDVRTPLNSIIGISDSLKDKKLSNDIKDDILDINTSAYDALNIIDDLLDTRKIEKAIIKKEEKEYNLLEMFNVIEKNAKDYMGDKNLKLNINLDNNLPVILYGDYKRITSALNKVVNNSIKYTSEGNITINVKGEKKDSNVNLNIQIIDTGSGIDKETLEKVISSNDINTDLGSVKNIIAALSGKFEIESKLNEYTKVTISFNQKIVEDNKIRKTLDNNKNVDNINFNNKRVLVVDDNALNLKVTKRLLENFNLDVTLLESGEECLNNVKENKYDLILMDQMMPGLSGLDTMKKIKSYDGFNTPVVVLTADAMLGQKEKYLSDGFDDYISKPVDKKELKEVLKKFLS